MSKTIETNTRDKATGNRNLIQVIVSDKEPNERGIGQVHDGHAGRLILRWNEWLVMRKALDADPRYRIAEVENPTNGQIKHHLSDRGGNDNE